MSEETGNMKRPVWEPRFKRARPGTVSTGLLLRGYTVVFFERFLSAFWLFLTVLAGSVALAASGWLPTISTWLHIAALVLMAGLIVWQLVEGFRNYRRPRRADVMRHLEKANKLDHRPLEALEDKIAFGDGDAAAQSLWALHRRQAIDASQGMGAGLADPKLSRRDPFAFRLAALLVLLAMTGLAGERAVPNIIQTLQPQFAPRTDLALVTVDAWITPPEYTSVAPVFLARTGDAEEAESKTQVPIGSKLVIQVSGAEEPPQLHEGESETPFDTNGPRSHRIEMDLSESTGLTVSIDSEDIVAWQIGITPDNPPTAALSDRPIGLTERRSLELDYKATDDYGVVSLSMEIRRTEEKVEGDEIISVGISAPEVGERDVTGATFVNLLEHIWAGDQVYAELKVEDAIGQTTYSEPLQFVLPERDFQHPVARALIDQRKILALGGPEIAADVGYDLQAIGQAKEIYGGDVVVYMGLSLIHRRLADDRNGLPDEETIRKMVDLLWDLALRLEDGDLSVAERRLREAERALAEAIERGASEEEIDQLMSELQEALNEYMRAMAQETLRQMQEGDFSQNPMDEDAQTLAQSDIDAIMDRIRELLQQGQKEAAQRLLQQLQRMMENLQAGVTNRPSPEAMEAMEMLEGMQQLMQGQQELLDRTFRNSQESDQMKGHNQNNQNQSGQNLQQGDSRSGSGPRGADAALQEALRQQLGDIRKRYEQMMGNSPQSFGQADREMRRSSDALRQDAPGEAVGPQGRALDQMREAARSAQEAFMERYGSQMGQGQQAQGQGSQTPPDPFNRRQGQTGIGTENDSSDVNIPTDGELKRAREIRDELRRRSSDRDRPQPELEYLERLLNPFD